MLIEYFPSRIANELWVVLQEHYHDLQWEDHDRDDQ